MTSNSGRPTWAWLHPKSESGFVFATDWARVELDHATGELILVVNTALMGEWSALHRFSYQVVATVMRVGTEITGTISWPTELYRPESEDPALAQSVLTVTANRYESVPSTGGNFGHETLTPLVPGAINQLTVSRDQCRASYRIANPPMATDLKVTLNVAKAFSAKGPGANIAWGGARKGPTTSRSRPNTPPRKSTSRSEHRSSNDRPHPTHGSVPCSANTGGRTVAFQYVGSCADPNRVHREDRLWALSHDVDRADRVQADRTRSRVEPVFQHSTSARYLGDIAD